MKTVALEPSGAHVLPCGHSRTPVAWTAPVPLTVCGIAVTAPATISGKREAKLQ